MAVINREEYLEALRYLEEKLYRQVKSVYSKRKTGSLVDASILKELQLYQDYLEFYNLEKNSEYYYADVLDDLKNKLNKIK